MFKLIKRVYKIEFGIDTGAYLVTDGARFLFYNLDGVFIATAPMIWRLIEKLGTVETAGDFERLTGRRPELFVQDCRICERSALLLVEHDDGICVDCCPEESRGELELIN